MGFFTLWWGSDGDNLSCYVGCKSTEQKKPAEPGTLGTSTLPP